jgi:hypothetical protein
LPDFDINEMLECLKKLAIYEKEWLLDHTEPDQLFMRIVHLSTDKTLGVRTPQNTKIIAMVNPVMLRAGPISLKCSTDVKKNWPLGHG